MSYKRLTDEETNKANKANIEDYIRSLGLAQKHAGKTIKVEGFGGLYIDPKENRWYCFSEGKGGGPIQLVMHIEKKTWIEAVKQLIGDDSINPHFQRDIEKEKHKDKEEFHLPEKNNTYKHMMAYLVQTRKIDKDIVYKYINNKTLYEDKKRNCVFVGYDNENNPRYAGLRGTLSNAKAPFKGEALNSDKAFSFHSKGTTDEVYVFESAIELMSYKTLQKITSKSFENHYMLSLGGLTSVALNRYLNDNPNIEKINLCLNNDDRGLEATEDLAAKYRDNFTIEIKLPKLKDWNEDLISISEAIKKTSKPNIKRNIYQDEWDMEL